MNNKSCGCNKNMTSRTMPRMPRMPRSMAAKSNCSSCKANNWSNENACGNDYEMQQETNCGYQNSCGMRQYANCARCNNSDMGMNKNWAKKYESTCTRAYDENFGTTRKYRKCNKNCELTFGEEVDDLPIGMGYVPYQEWDCNVSNACQGLYDGTIFPELVKPFVCTYCYEERRGR